MFTVVNEPTFRHDVDIHEPVDGGHRIQKLNVTFRLVPDEDGDDAIAMSDEQIKDHLRRRIVCFNDLGDEKGNTLPYNDEIREQLLARQDVRLGLIRGYAKAVTKGAAGN